MTANDWNPGPSPSAPTSGTAVTNRTLPTTGRPPAVHRVTAARLGLSRTRSSSPDQPREYGQAIFYESSDWAAAALIAFDMTQTGYLTSSSGDVVAGTEAYFGMFLIPIVPADLGSKIHHLRFWVVR